MHESHPIEVFHNFGKGIYFTTLKLSVAVRSSLAGIFICQLCVNYDFKRCRGNAIMICRFGKISSIFDTIP